jgi:hypothetical protein
LLDLLREIGPTLGEDEPTEQSSEQISVAWWSGSGRSGCRNEENLGMSRKRVTDAGSGHGARFPQFVLLELAVDAGQASA